MGLVYLRWCRDMSYIKRIEIVVFGRQEKDGGESGGPCKGI